MELNTIYVLIGIILFGIGMLVSFLFFRLRLKNKELQLTHRLKETEIKLANAVDNHHAEKQNLENQLNKLEVAGKETTKALQTQLIELRSEKEFLSNELTRKSTEYTTLQQATLQQKEEFKKVEDRFRKEFENLAHKILEDNSEKFTRLNKDNMENILSPLQERIKGFEEKVEKSREATLQRHSELGKQLELLNRQNLKISEEATNLTKALKGDSKMQGNWGEVILERVLEQSGLKKDHEYFTQQSFKTPDNRRLQPDVVVSLPGDKKMIIDSKVSLKAYEGYVNTEQESAKNNFLNQHLLSLKRHIQELSGKKYELLYPMESPDFVLLFIPIEAAFAVASNAYPALYADAFQKNIILVTPTTLLAVLRTIENMWQNEKQKENTLQIATQAGRLYDTFVSLLEELEKIGNQLNTVQNSYDRAMVKLKGRGNLINRVEKLKKLGAKTSKEMDPKLLDTSSDIPLKSKHS